jgi:hypothetical protein
MLGGAMPSHDEYLIAKIQKALATDPRVHKQDVDVAICGDRIHLTGRTSTEERRRIIGMVVSETAPEFDVKNEIDVIELSGPAQPEIIGA